MHEHRQLELVPLRGGRQGLEEVEAGQQVGHGLPVRRLLDGAQPGGDAVRDRAFGKAGVREVVREHLG